MRKLKITTALALLSLSTPLLAINVMKYTTTMNTPINETQRTTLVGIFESCGDITNMDDSCVLQGLERVATEENNTYAQNLVKSYDDALNEGDYSNPECQQESHSQANRIIGHCILLMNFYALSTNDNASASSRYSTCLQGGMQGLVYQGNIVAQFLLGQLYEQKGLSDTAAVWERAVKVRKDTDEYNALVKCYNR